MPKYILHYFDAAGRAEVIRLIFHHAGVEFEDHRFKKDEWLEFKKNEKLLPFGQVPVLEVDGEVLGQSFAIARYLANEFGLCGKTNMEKAKGDMLVDGFGDMGLGMIAVFKEQDETRKAALKKDYFENQLPKSLQLYENKFIPNEGFLFGDSITLADLHFHGTVGFLSALESGILDNFPKAKALNERIANTPNIKKYYDSKK